MTRCRSRSVSAQATSPAVVWLLALAVALGALHGVQPLHLHHGETTGLYNEAHVLAALDTVTVEAPLPSAPVPARIAIVPGFARHPAAVTPAAPIARLPESRAPPLA